MTTIKDILWALVCLTLLAFGGYLYAEYRVKKLAAEVRETVNDITTDVKRSVNETVSESITKVKEVPAEAMQSGMDGTVEFFDAGEDAFEQAARDIGIDVDEFCYQRDRFSRWLGLTY